MKETLSSRFRKFTSGTLALAMIASIVAPIGNVVNAAGTPDFTAIQTVASEAAGVNNQSFNINSNTLNGTGSYATGASSGIDGIDIIAANVGTGTNLVNVTITDNDTDDCFLTTMSGSSPNYAIECDTDGSISGSGLTVAKLHTIVNATPELVSLTRGDTGAIVTPQTITMAGGIDMVAQSDIIDFTNIGTGDTLTVTINGTQIDYVATTTSGATAHAAIETLINNSTQSGAVTAVNNNGAYIVITSDTPGTPYSIVLSTVNKPAVAQVVRFTPTFPESGVTYRATIDSVNYDILATGATTVPDILTYLAGLVNGDGGAVVSCSPTATYMDCTADVAGAASFTFSALASDITAPAGYTISVPTYMTGGNEASFPLDITNGETGTLFAYSFSDFGAVNTVTGSSSLGIADGNIANIDLSILGEGTGSVSLYLFDGTNTGSTVNASFYKDTIAPTITISSFPDVNVANSGAVTLTGTCSTGDGNVSVAVGGQSATPSCSGGTWLTTLNLSSESATGATADQTDAVGNAATQATATNSRDVVAPIVDIDSIPLINSSNSGAALFTGSCTFGDSVVSYTIEDHLAQTLTGTTSCNITGDWSESIDVSSLDEGSITGTVSQTDLAGNFSSFAAPTSKDIYGPNPLSFGALESVNSSNSGSIDIPVFECEPGQDVTVTVSGTGHTDIVLTGACYSTGNLFTGIDVSGFDDGTVDLLLEQSDSFGNLSQTYGTLSKDTIAPSMATNLQLEITNTYNSGGVHFTGSGDADASFDYSITDASGATSSGTYAVDSSGTINWSQDVSMLLDGTLTLEVVMMDGNGNRSSTGSTTAIKDTLLPTVSITLFPDVNVANSGAVTLTGTCSTGDGNVSVAVGSATGSASCSAGTWSQAFDLSSESSTGARADQTDAVGNHAIQATATNSRDVIVPTLSLVSPVVTPTNDTTPSFTFSSTETGTISYSGSCSSVTTSAVPGANTITLSALAEGVYSNCSITVTDTAYNTSTPLSITSFTIDTTGPTVAISTSPVTIDANAYLIQGAVTGGTGGVTISGGGSGATAPIDGSGAFRAMVYLTQNTTNTLIVSAQDSLGNIGTGSVVITESGSTGDFSSSITVTASDFPYVATASGGNPAATTQLTIETPITFNPVGNIRVTLPAGTEITQSGGTSFDATQIQASNTGVSSGLGSYETSNGAIEFGISNIGLNFSKPIKVEIPVTGVTSGTITVKVKHGGTSTFVTTGLTNDPNATCANGIPSVTSNIATVTAGVATIYTCSASTFTTYTYTPPSSGGGGSGIFATLVTATGTTTNTGVTVTEEVDNTEDTSIESTPSFKDISKSFARSYIETLAELGVVSGFSDGTFRPENSATRAEFIKMVLKGFDISPILDIKKSSFSDVTVSWQVGYIEKAKQMGIIKGQIEGDMRVFRPNENISRVEALKILFGAAKIAVDASLSSSQFSDVTIAWQIPYVEKAKSLNIVNGQTQDGKLIFRPNASITRAELAKILVKVLEME